MYLNTELGALTLQSDLRKIVDGMNNLLEEGSVRSQVEELQIFVWLLNVERPSDVEDSPLIKKSSMARDMSSTDIGEILSLRVEMQFLKEVERLYKVSSGIDRLRQMESGTTSVPSISDVATSGGDTINGVLDSIGGFMSASASSIMS